jgi:hypothetical protein
MQLPRRGRTADPPAGLWPPGEKGVWSAHLAGDFAKSAAMAIRMPQKGALHRCFATASPSCDLAGSVVGTSPNSKPTVLSTLLAEGQAGDAARSSIACLRRRYLPEAPITRHVVGVFQDNASHVEGDDPDLPV